ncbi:hypothetical protein Ga0102493_1134 [Erythrobacter litoralis]|uniref:Glycosyltransferase RgtA/B/C/D-like domain-containing protein n=1 Tax=Erythrobacter litoralis TaxID=39960 RepID=A0A074N3A4_9SPHN|nr:hypothetical protein [Erythrobacter litoralis]AOL24181.1 hypothetical protein Ga0102493_1134 [Erythrobacter litoralis]KEO99300.1 hypothetical protein EH32_00295 [Erythrobacter litoralis]
MILSVLLTGAIAALALTPGLLLVWGRATTPGVAAASCTASLAAMLLATGLLGILAEKLLGVRLPASTLVPVALAASVAAAAWRGGDLRRGGNPGFEWRGAVVSAVLVVFGLASISLAIRETGEGALMVHSWYNADWFKHMGHVHALAGLGLPARDIFGGAGPLHYYWLSYILPGAAADLGAEPWAALSTMNAVVSVLLGLLLYALARIVVPSRARALGYTLAALIVLAPAGFLIYLVGGGSLEAFLSSGLTPHGSGLLETSQVIPQHALATALIAAWILLDAPDTRAEAGASRLLALAGLAALLAISTLLGAIYLLAYGLSRLYAGRLAAVPELALMVVAAGTLVLVLSVLQVGNPASAIESPLLTDAVDPRPDWLLALLALSKAFALAGVPLFLVLPFLPRLRAEDARERHAMIAAYGLLVATILAVAGSQILLPERPAAEIFVRSKMPFSLAALTLGALLLERLRTRHRLGRVLPAAICTALAVLALPSIYSSLRWKANFGDVHTVVVPAQDRAVLAALRALSEPHELVWQYPEKPLVGDPRGVDNWSAIFAGRPVPNSERATDYAAAAPSIALSQAWFVGDALAIPEDIDWVYLSRALHPGSYDALAAKMERDPAFARSDCYEDACLFERRANSTP